MATDTIPPYSSGKENPADFAFAITPADGADLTYLTRAIYVGGLGDVACQLSSGSTVTFVGAQGILPIRVSRVLSTGTTATSIIGLY